MGIPPGSETRQRPPLTPAIMRPGGDRGRKFEADALVSLGTLLGFIYYVFVGSAYRIFYIHLGVSPEEVGIDFAAILSRSLLGFIPIALFIILVFGPIPFFWLGRRPSGMSRFFGTVFFLAAGGILLYFKMQDYGVKDYLLILPLVLWGAAFTIGPIFQRNTSPGVDGLQLTPTAVFLLLVFVCGLFASSIIVGRSAADNLMKQGDAFPPGTLNDLSSLALGLKPRPVTIEWSEPTQKPESIGATDELILLGKSEGIIVLFNRTRGEVIRLAGSSLTLNPKNS